VLAGDNEGNNNREVNNRVNPAFGKLIYPEQVFLYANTTIHN